MKLLVMASLFLAGCASTAPTMIILVHPTTAERISCQFGSGNPHPLIVLNDQRRTENCAQQYEALGFVRATDLSPAQKAKLSFPQPIVEQDITIRQAPPKAP
jgi:hypothetical protein